MNNEALDRILANAKFNIAWKEKARKEIEEWDSMEIVKGLELSEQEIKDLEESTFCCGCVKKEVKK